MVRSTKAMGRNGEDPEVFAESYMHDYSKWIFTQAEMRIENIRGEDVEKVVQKLKETAGGLYQWDPANLKLISKEACRHFATFFDMIEKGGEWPKDLRVARAAFLAKEEDSDMNPLDYNVLLMLASVYRLWGKIRLEQLQPWIETWQLPEIYAGIEGQGGTMRRTPRR